MVQFILSVWPWARCSCCHIVDKARFTASLFPFNKQGIAFQTSCLIRTGKASCGAYSFFQSVWLFLDFSLHVCSVLHPAVPMLWMSHPRLFWYLWRETSHIWIVPRFSFSKIKSDHYPRTFSGSMKVKGVDVLPAGYMVCLGLFLYIFLTQSASFSLLPSWSLKDVPQPSPALLPQGPVVCCTFLPWHSWPLPHTVSHRWS